MYLGLRIQFRDGKTVSQSFKSVGQLINIGHIGNIEQFGHFGHIGTFGHCGHIGYDNGHISQLV